MRETMDNFLNTFLSSSWSDVIEFANQSWGGNISSETDGLHSDSYDSFQVDGKNSAISMIPSSHIMENVYAAQQPIHYSQSPSHCIEANERNFSIPDSVTCNSTGIPYGLESDSSLRHSTLTISNSLESSGTEPPTFGQSVEEVHSVPSVPTIWPSSYSEVSFVSGQQNVENFRFDDMTNGVDLLSQSQNELSSNFVTFANEQQMKMTGDQGTTEAAIDLQLPSFSGGPHMSFSKTSVMHASPQSEGTTLNHQLGNSFNSHQQITQASAFGCIMAAKPRVRARRGQATDPHSIAERFRREKISERMKSLQELVPNSNKTDKASML